MAKIICMGDQLSHGGVVLEASPDVFAKGVQVAREGDQCMCAIHKLVSIVVTGSGKYRANGRKIAREGDMTTCGAQLVAKVDSIDLIG